jgi:CRP/FNR family transcriptional regulator
MDLISLLGQLQLFAELDSVALERLAARCVPRNVAEGHVLFTAGQECRGLFIVETGRVRIFRVSSDGREQVLHVEGPGRAVAELPLLDGGTYPASAVTLEKSRLVFLPREDFEYLYRTHPDIAHAIIRALARRLRHLVHVAETLAFRDVAARLAMLLAGYAERSEQRDSKGVLLKLDRTQEELALEIGTARESVSRAMKQLRRKGLIAPAGNRQLNVPSVEALRAFARGARTM